MILKLLNNSLNKDYLLALAQDLDNQEELMATFWKEKNLNFTPKRLTKERNDSSQLNIYLHSLFVSIFPFVSMLVNINIKEAKIFYQNI